jgi:hypothetical protein
LNVCSHYYHQTPKMSTVIHLLVKGSACNILFVYAFQTHKWDFEDLGNICGKTIIFHL